MEPSEQRFEFADDATWTKGTHTFKFGADYANTEDYTYYISNAFGSYTYQTPTQFALDYSGNTAGLKIGLAIRKLSANRLSMRRSKNLASMPRISGKYNKLTVTLGGRYEHSYAPQPPITNPDWPQTGPYHTGTLDLAPRVGIAYRLNNKTVLRGGYGTFFARFLGSLVDNYWTTNGLYQIADSFSSTNKTQLAAGPIFPNSLAAPPTGASVAASTIQFASPTLKTPYSEQATITAERQLTDSMVVSASGIWSRA